MERAKPYLKVAAVVSAVCLVGAFVAYRAGAFDSPPPPAPPPAPEAQSAPGPVPPPTPETPTSPTFMLGSKSAYVYDENALKALTQSTQTGSPANPVFLGGSKTFVPLIGPGIGTTPAEKASQPVPPALVPPKKDQ